MNYELAKELKDAGFPQGLMPLYDSEGYIHRSPEEEESRVYRPALSELIEACNPAKSDDMGLKTDLDRWHAFYDYNGYFEHHDKFKDADEMYAVQLNVYGQTPEEAIARLWLSLNKK